MIRNDRELKTTQERIAYFQRLLGQLRVTAALKNLRSWRAATGRK
jgi:hypothetical protein